MTGGIRMAEIVLRADMDAVGDDPGAWSDPSENQPLMERYLALADEWWETTAIANLSTFLDRHYPQLRYRITMPPRSVMPSETRVTMADPAEEEALSEDVLRSLEDTYDQFWTEDVSQALWDQAADELK
jgi:hypothetical protein